MPTQVNHNEATGPKAKADREIIAFGIAVAAIMLFVAIGGSLMPQIVFAWQGRGEPPDPVLVNALLLNIALLLFGWRRYSDLKREIEERKLAEQRAQVLAATDPLTGCLNRRSIRSEAKQMLTDATRLGQAVAVVMFDLDNFKSINDNNGHKVGDIVLVESSKRARALLPAAAKLARIGGDEFMFLVAFEPDNSGAIDDFAKKLVEEVSEAILVGDRAIHITVSAGIATTLDVGAELPIDELAHRADIALYEAKKRGRNRYFRFSMAMERDQHLRKEMEDAMRIGIVAGEFVPFFEQQIDLETGKLVGFEMLARWNSAQLGSISPEVFIPVAEDADLIGAVSEILIRKALSEAKEWHHSLTLSINISPLQMRDPWFAQKLLQMLVEAGFPPQRLEVEITESCLHESLENVRAIITSLKNQGIRLSLDDFGTGYSSLAQLRSLPFDRLKIDRSFVSDLASGNGNVELVEAIVALGRGLDLPVTAEGVESAEVMNLLRSMGDIKTQGYYFGQPESASETRNRLAVMNMLAENGDGVEEPQPGLPIPAAPQRKSA